MKTLLAEILFVLSWSSGFIGAKIGVDAGGPVTLLFWRFALVTLILLLLLGSRLRELQWKVVREQVIIGFLSQFIYLIFIYTAIENGVSPGVAAIIAALQPMMTAALAAGSGSEHVFRTQWIGLVLGFGGVCLVITGQYSLQVESSPLIYYLFPVVSALALTVSSLYQRRVIQGQDIFLCLLIQSSSNLVLFAILGSVTGDLRIPAEAPVWISVVWLTVFSTLIAYAVYWMLLRKVSATRVSVLVYFEPPVTLIWASLMFDDHIVLSTYGGLAVSAVGVVLTRLRQSRPARRDRHPARA